MRYERITLFLAVALVLCLGLLYPAVAANASAGIAAGEANADLYYSDNTTTNVEPPAPPPPPPAPTTTITSPQSTITFSPPAVTAHILPAPLQTDNSLPAPDLSHPAPPIVPPATPPAGGHHPPVPPGPHPPIPPNPPDHHRPTPHFRPPVTYYPPYQPTYPYTWVWPAYNPPVTIYEEPAVVIYPPVISSFTANPSYIQPGQAVTLSWTVNNADTVNISPLVGTVANTGSFVVAPTYTTTYTLTAYNSAGTITASTIVTVAPYVTSYTTGINSPDAYANVETYGTTSVASATVNTAGVAAGNTALPNLWISYALLVGLLAIAAGIIVVLLVRKPAVARIQNPMGTNAGYSSSSTALAASLPATSIPVTTPGEETGLPAKFVSPGGTTMPVTGRPLGRRDLQALLPPEKADLISRQHIRVTYEANKYFIEDVNSTNGTKLNGSEIKGIGKRPVENGDSVELAGVLTLTFKV